MHHLMSVTERNNSGSWGSTGEMDHRKQVGFHGLPKQHPLSPSLDTEYWTRWTVCLT